MNDKPKKKNPGGRPTDYRSEYNGLVYKLALLGLIDVEMAEVLGCSEKTLNNWKSEHPQFLQSIKDGKVIANANVAQSLYHRAIGYSHPEDKFNVVDNELIITESTKHYPPDTAAAFIWLKNRDGARWRDKQIVEVRSFNINVELIEDDQDDDDLIGGNGNGHLLGDGK